MGSIYKITSKVNGKFYIGKTTKTLAERFYHHCKSNSAPLLHRGILKWGADNYSIKMLESQVPEDLLDERERHWIAALSPPLNITEGGQGGDTSKSENFIEAMKRYHSRKPKEEYATYGMKGKKQSQKWFNSIREANSKPVCIEGVQYPSITEAQKAHPGVKVRYRIKSKNYPDWFQS